MGGSSQRLCVGIGRVERQCGFGLPHGSAFAALPVVDIAEAHDSIHVRRAPGEDAVEHRLGLAPPSGPAKHAGVRELKVEVVRVRGPGLHQQRQCRIRLPASSYFQGLVGGTSLCGEWGGQTDK